MHDTLFPITTLFLSALIRNISFWCGDQKVQRDDRHSNREQPSDEAGFGKPDSRQNKQAYDDNDGTQSIGKSVSAVFSMPVYILPDGFAFRVLMQRIFGNYFSFVIDGGFSCILIKEIRSEEHTSELQSLMRISNAVFC